MTVSSLVLCKTAVPKVWVAKGQKNGSRRGNPDLFFSFSIFFLIPSQTELLHHTHFIGLHAIEVITAL